MSMSLCIYVYVDARVHSETRPLPRTTMNQLSLRSCVEPQPTTDDANGEMSRPVVSTSFDVTREISSPRFLTLTNPPLRSDDVMIYESQGEKKKKKEKRIRTAIGIRDGTLDSARFSLSGRHLTQRSDRRLARACGVSLTRTNHPRD